MHATNKPFNIDKRWVYEAYKAVKSNRGAAGVDEQTIEQFDADLSGNLYKIWNRMSSGTYFPPPVRAVARRLRLPTILDAVGEVVGFGQEVRRVARRVEFVKFPARTISVQPQSFVDEGRVDFEPAFRSMDAIEKTRGIFGDSGLLSVTFCYWRCNGWKKKKNLKHRENTGLARG